MADKKPINWINFITVWSLGILVGTELVGMSWAAGWAIGGLFQLPRLYGFIIEIFFTILGFIGLFYFMRMALKNERIRG